MRDFSWQYFSNTGDVEAYMLFRQVSEQHAKDVEEEEKSAEEKADSSS